MAKLPYAAWASMVIRKCPKAEQQAIRAKYYSDNGKAEHYDTYRNYCRELGMEFDPPPPGYTQYKAQPWHTPAALGISLMGALVYFLIGLIGGTTGKK